MSVQLSHCKKPLKSFPPTNSRGYYSDNFPALHHPCLHHKFSEAKEYNCTQIILRVSLNYLSYLDINYAPRLSYF